MLVFLCLKCLIVYTMVLFVVSFIALSLLFVTYVNYIAYTMFLHPCVHALLTRSLIRTLLCIMYSVKAPYVWLTYALRLLYIMWQAWLFTKGYYNVCSKAWTSV